MAKSTTNAHSDSPRGMTWGEFRRAVERVCWSEQHTRSPGTAQSTALQIREETGPEKPIWSAIAWAVSCPGQGELSRGMVASTGAGAGEQTLLLASSVIVVLKVRYLGRSARGDAATGALGSLLKGLCRRALLPYVQLVPADIGEQAPLRAWRAMLRPHDGDMP